MPTTIFRGRRVASRPVATIIPLALVVTLLTTACEDTTTAVVTAVVDGDTIDVQVDGEERRVRLLNIDTPESVDPNHPVECLGPEAARFLADRLPVGTEVELAHDAVRTDRYDRDLAAVFHDEDLVNAEIARAGFAETLVVDGNDRFYDEIERARADAEANGVGLYATDIACTVPAQVAAFDGQVTQALAGAPTSGATLDDLDAYGETLAALALAGGALDAVLLSDGALALGLPDATRHGLVAQRDDALGRVTTAQARQQETRAAEEQRLAAEAAEAARAAEEQRVAAAEQEAARVAAEKEAARAEQERRAAADRAASPVAGSTSGSGAEPAPPASPPTPEAPAPSGTDAGYTGCRAYGPAGTSVDSKGRPFTKIDCTTKLPIG